MRSRSKNEDRLSYLPDEVLKHILSLMPTKFAVRTSTLSKKWRYIWTLVTILDFDCPRSSKSSKWFLEFVDRVLQLCKTSQLQLFRFRETLFMLKKSQLLKWMNEAVRLNVCEVDIQVTETELPHSLFTCKTLTKLKLAIHCGLDVKSVPSQVTLPGLKTLDIRVSRKSSVIISKFVHGCPVLESLTLDVTSSDSNEKDYNLNIPTLKRFELRTGCTFKLVLNVPNLEYLFVGGEFCPHFVMEDLPSSVQATVSVRDMWDYGLELLKGLSGVKSISWSMRSLPRPAISALPKFPNLKHLELKGSSSNLEWMLVIQILEGCSKLEDLCLELLDPQRKKLQGYYERKHLCYQPVNGLFFELGHVLLSIFFQTYVTSGSFSGFVTKSKPQGSCWIKPQSVPTCMISNLKTMKFTKCKARKCDVKFLKYLLKNAKVLKRLTVICDGTLHVEEEMKLRTRLLKVPKASMFCEIHFVGRWVNFCRILLD